MVGKASIIATTTGLIHTIVMSDGIDAKEFSNRWKAANRSERPELIAKYFVWIVEGARAQGWRGTAGVMLFASSLFVSLLGIIYGSGLVWLYAACALGAIAGFLLMRVAFRRERDWRRANPFQY